MSERGGFLWLVQIGRIFVVIVCCDLIYQWISKYSYHKYFILQRRHLMRSKCRNLIFFNTHLFLVKIFKLVCPCRTISTLPRPTDWRTWYNYIFFVIFHFEYYNTFDFFCYVVFHLLHLLIPLYFHQKIFI